MDYDGEVEVVAEVWEEIEKFFLKKACVGWWRGVSWGCTVRAHRGREIASCIVFADLFANFSGSLRSDHRKPPSFAPQLLR